MARIALVIPPGLSGTTANPEGAAGLGAVEETPGAFRYPPHTVATVASVLRTGGDEVRIVDAEALGLDADGAVQAALDSEPELIGVFVSWATQESDRAYLAALRAKGALGVPVVAFGPSTRHMPQALADADLILEGEAELAFGVLSRRALSEPAGLERVVTPEALGVPSYDAHGLLRDLNTLPIPAWDLVPLERYSCVSILNSRGCGEACNWCPYVVAQGRRFRACSPERVLSELRELVSRYQPRRIVFRDPAFAFDRARVEGICRAIRASRELHPGKDLLWECESYPEHLDSDLLGEMSLAGCMGVKVGLESTDAGLLYRGERVRAESDVSAYLAHVARLAGDCARKGIACRLFVMVGLPWQTVEAARETAVFVGTLPIDTLTVKRFKGYPGLKVSQRTQPSEEEVRAQEAAFQEVQRALLERPTRPAKGWRRAMEHVLARLARARRKAGG
jgi:radical SAM superfamily enzyme YgiQ (UPF0313 family)